MSSNNTKQERQDRDVLKTDTRQIRILGPRTVQETRSSHWYGYTIVVRARNPKSDWIDICRFDVRGKERWDRNAINHIGSKGALVTDVPSESELNSTIKTARRELEVAEIDGRISEMLA